MDKVDYGNLRLSKRICKPLDLTWHESFVMFLMVFFFFKLILGV